MHEQITNRTRSVWANLDAIVLEEVKALRPAARAAEASAPEEDRPFRSDDEFMDCATAYLGGRGTEAYRLIDRLRDMLGPDQAGGGTVDPQESAEAGSGSEVDPPTTAAPPEIPPGQEK